MINTGKLRLFGKHVGELRTRLLETVMPKESTIYVEKGMSWVPGDVLALPSTTMKWWEKDMVRVKTYNNETGETTLVEPVNFYHWGAAVSTAADYSGVDMRGEVMLMTRNIKIQGANNDGWGC